jgi:hypothetical protein
VQFGWVGLRSDQSLELEKNDYRRIFINTRTIAFAVCATGLIAETLYGCHIMPACSWHVSIKQTSKVLESTYWDRI